MADFCIGTAQFGMEYGVANKIGQPTQYQVYEIVKYAIDNGCQYFDTAQSYGISETILGKAIAEIETTESIRVVSKLSPNLQGNSSESIINSVKTSIRKLNVELLHGFLAHRIEATFSDYYIDAVNRLKSEGLILKSGASVYTPDEAKASLENPVVDILQIPLNILDRRWIDEQIIERAEEKNVQLFFRSIFLQGLIFLNQDELKKRKMDWAQPYLHQFHKLAAETTNTPAELAIAIISNISSLGVIIFGVDSLKQLKMNINCLKRIKYDKTLSSNWWKSIPLFPEKLLNPSLWN